MQLPGDKEAVYFSSLMLANKSIFFLFFVSITYLFVYDFRLLIVTMAPQLCIVNIHCIPFSYCLYLLQRYDLSMW